MGIKFDNKALNEKNKEAIKESKKAERKENAKEKDDSKRDDGTYTWRPFANLKAMIGEKK